MDRLNHRKDFGKARALVATLAVFGLAFASPDVEGGAGQTLMLAGHVTPRQHTHIRSSAESLSREQASSEGGAELARIIHQTNSDDGFAILIAGAGDSDAGLSIEIDPSRKVRPSKAAQVLKLEPGRSRPSRYDYRVRLKLDSRAPSRPAETLTLSIVAL